MIKGLAGRIKWLRGGVETERANPLLLGPKTFNYPTEGVID